MQKSQFLEVALEAAQAAEKVIMKYYNSQIGAQLKADRSPVTVADTEAEQVIFKIISNAFPDHQFLGEESGEKTAKSEYLWIVDPIDGTKNYMRGIPLFATQIALMKDGELILGVSNAPALNELLYAEKNCGAYCNDSIIYVSKVEDLAEAYLSYGNIKHFDELKIVPELVTLIDTVRNPRGIGDAWSYHLLAQGKIDIMVDAKTKIWDIAAVKVIVEEAGGKVTDLQGNSITQQTSSIIATNSILHKLVLNTFSN